MKYKFIDLLVTTPTRAKGYRKKNQKIRKIPPSAQSVMQTKKAETNPDEINPAVLFSG
jgi:ABC-type uncharacterized transport system auxiliary subunit